MTDVIAEQGAMIDGVANPSATASRLGGAGHLKNAIAKAIADGTASATASRLGAQGRIYAIAGGGEISPGMSGGTAWSPSALFASSEVGVWYDPSDLSTMFQNSDGTTAVEVGDPVGYIADKSGNGFHATQATAASRPVLRESGGLYYLEFDGTDDFLVTSAIDFSATDEMSVFSGFTRLVAGALTQRLFALASFADGAFWANVLGAAETSFSIDGGNLLSPGVTPPAVGTPVVFSGYGDISNDTITVEIQPGTAETINSEFGAVANLTASVVGICGNTAGGSSAAIGLYQFIIRNKYPTPTEIDNAEAYVNGKTGAY